jgi:hypothetical protein
MFMVFYAIFYNISVILRGSVLLVEQTTSLFIYLFIYLFISFRRIRVMNA